MTMVGSGEAYGQSARPYNPNVERGKYRNPVIYADYSDPDVCRVGEDFYMTASSFSCFPGLPILHSKNLVNWTIVGHAITHYPEELREVFRVPQHGGGVWAPAIRYHAGKFWIFFADPDHGILMTTAEKAEGPWTPLHLVQKSYGWIDTCPFWDEDGQAYLVHGFANSRSKLSNILWLHRMAADGTRLLDDGKCIFDARGIYTTVEGPKLYKRGGIYYVFAPGGGVTGGYQLALRSKEIWGPYEHRIVMDSGKTQINGPHQGAWVDAADGRSDWFVHFQEVLPYGRITHLQPMRWENDWPVIGEAASGAVKGEPVLVHALPVVGQKTGGVAMPQTSDEFEEEKLGLQWQWWGEYREEWYSLTAAPGNLRLYAAGAPAGVMGLYDRANLLLQKFPARKFTATAKVDVSHLAPRAKAGLVLAGKVMASLHVERLGDNETRLAHTSFAYRPPASPRGTTDAKRFDAPPYGPVPAVTITPPTPFPAPSTQAPATQGDSENAHVNVAGTTLYLRMTCDEMAVCTFSYSLDGKEYRVLGKTVTAVNDTWIGAKVGLFCNAVASTAPDEKSTFIDVDWFRFE